MGMVMTATTINPLILRQFALLLCGLFSSMTTAAQWQVSPFFETKLDFSDNILLSKKAEENSFVAQLNPGVNLSGTGKRTQIALDYRLQTLFYSSKNIENNQYHQGSGYLGYELIDDKLTLYTDASYGQGSKDIYRSSLDDNINDPNNIANIFRMSAGIIWEQQIKHSAFVYLNANANYLDEQESLPDEKGWNITFNTNSTYQVSSGFWQANYSGSQRKPKFSEESLLQKGQIQVGPQILPHLVLYATADKEENDVPNSVVNIDLNSESVGIGTRWQPNQRAMLAVAYNLGTDSQTPDHWSLDFSLTPNPRVQIAGSYGQRFYGNAYDFSLNYQRKKTHTRLVYTEGLSSYSRSDGNTVAGFCPEGDASSSECTPANNVSDETIPEGMEPTYFYNSISSDVYLNRNALWSITRYSGRHALSLNLSYSEQDYVTREEEQRDLAGKFDWRIFLGPRTTFKLDTLYRKIRRSQRSSENQIGDTLQYGKEWISGISFNRQLSRHSHLELRLQRKDKDGITNTASYIEDRIGLYYTLK